MSGPVGADARGPAAPLSSATLLVDVANTVGARPDGWWRDRAAATARLLAPLARLAGTTVPGPDGAPLHLSTVVVVLEGQARDVDVPAPLVAVRAPGSGDDALAGTAAATGGDLLVVTADRRLRTRLPGAAAVAGPRWLRGLLDDAGNPAPDG